MSTKLSFEAWKRLVDDACWAIAGLGANDLPDWDYTTAYRVGMSAAAAARKAVRSARDF